MANKKFLNIFTSTLFILVVFVFSFSIRYNQTHLWEKSENIYKTGEYPAMATLDAYYWLRYAKEYDNGTYKSSSIDYLRFYPDGVKKDKPVPLLSYFIAKLSKLFNGSYYYAGLYLIPVLASFFIIPLCLYFYLIGFPLAGLMGAVLASVSYMYIARTSAGRVDTDALNLFFPIMASYFILLSFKSKKDFSVILYSALAGLTMYFFYFWYFHSGFHIVFFITLIVVLLVKKVHFKVLLASMIVYFIFSNPFYFIDGLGNLSNFFFRYLMTQQSNGGFNIPNIMETITEAQVRPISLTISSILSNPYISYVGLAGFLIIAILYYKEILPILPIFVLGLIAFKSSIRFVMYLSPFVGIGYGAIIHMLTKAFINYYKKQKEITIIFSYILAFLVLIFFVINFGAYKYIPTPSIESDIVSSFIDIKKMNLGKAKIATWWDYGYGIEDIAGFATYHDGGSQANAKTYFIAKALFQDNQTQLYNILSFISNHGQKGIDNLTKKNISNAEIVKTIVNYNKSIKEDNYLLFSKDMITKFRAISEIGSYDFVTRMSKPGGFQVLQCSNFSNRKLFCDNIVVDLEKGLINDDIPLKQAYFIDNGKISSSYNYYSNGSYVEIMLKDKSIIGVMLLDEATFNSNFNQLYILGNFDKTLFEEAYNKYPSVRMFKIKTRTSK